MSASHTLCAPMALAPTKPPKSPDRAYDMSDTPGAGVIPTMPPETAQEIARGLKWLAQSYAEAGMVRDATRVERDSQWWMTYSISLTQTLPAEKSA